VQWWGVEMVIWYFAIPCLSS